MTSFMSYFNNFVHIICLVICLFIHSLHIYVCIYSYIYREILFCFEWMYLGTGYSLPCVYFLSLKKRSCISSKRWMFFSVIFCSFSVDLLWNSVAVFQFNVKSLPHCWLYQACTVCFLVLFGLLVKCNLFCCPGVLCFIFGIYLYRALFIYYVSIFPLMYVHYDPLVCSTWLPLDHE